MEISLEVDFSQKINRLLYEDVRFSLFRLPEEEPVLLMQETDESNSALSPDELTNKEGFLIAPFAASPTAPIVLIEPEKMLVGFPVIESFLELLPDYPIASAEEESLYDPANESYEAYEEAFTVFVDALETGVLQKLVLSRVSTQTIPEGFSIYEVFKTLCEQHPEAFVYVCNTPETGAWMGCTPEPLLTRADDSWHTVALAGTRSEASDEGWDEKNKLEQQIVTEYLEKQFSGLGIVPEKSEIRTIKAGHLLHLETALRFNIPPNISVGRVLNVLHPTPAVCGFPKKESKRFILHNEPNERRYYSGYLGCINVQGRTDVYVNLRCMEITDGALRFHAGGGLLTTSELALEWKETEEKMETLSAVVYSTAKK